MRGTVTSFIQKTAELSVRCASPGLLEGTCEGGVIHTCRGQSLPLAVAEGVWDIPKGVKNVHLEPLGCACGPRQGHAPPELPYFLLRPPRSYLS